MSIIKQHLSSTILISISIVLRKANARCINYKKMKNQIIILLFLFLCGSISVAQKAKISLSNVVVKDVPEINWETLESDTVISAQAIQSFSAIVKSRVPLKNIKITLNSIQVEYYSQSEMKEPVAENLYEQPIEKTVTMRTGYNTIGIMAQNIHNIQQYSSRVVMINPELISVLRNEDDKTPPMIYFSTPGNLRDDYAILYASLIKLSGSILDESGVQSLEINGKNTPIRANGSFTINIPLTTGENRITVEAMDVNQNITVRKLTLERKNMDGSVYIPEKAKNYLIAVGINEYKYWPRLSNAVADLDTLVTTLITKYQFDSINSTFLTDSLATKKNIINTLRKHIELISPNDNLLIYFSGHGYFDELLNEGYWVPNEAEKDQVADYISNTDILNLIQNINSQHTFLVADACFSGSLFSASSRGYVENVEKYKSRWGLASGRLEAVSDGTEGENSPFNRSLVTYLNATDAEKITVSELVQYVKRDVSNKSDQTPIGNPLRSIGDEGGEFVFYKRKE